IMKVCTSLFVSMLLGISGHAFGQTGLSFDLGGPGENIQDHLVFSSEGVTATATAWSVDRNQISSGFAASEVVQWSPGLGVKNSTEFITDTPYVPCYVDNQDHFDFILFVFSQKVDIQSITVHPSAGTFDLDASYWLGNIDPALDLSGSGFGNLAAYGFGSRMDNDSFASNSPRSFGISSPTGGVNAMLIGARIDGDGEFDRFKISGFSGVTVIPEPSSLLMGLGALGIAMRRRRRDG
ncbi:MAG: PEP-CTERM sorting domain-containing protein, partial [Akkermansiaceae bacterium]|nr:PEP-CTERM sorting domain-containing protein [Akkermansiaceae bacterium]